MARYLGSEQLLGIGDEAAYGTAGLVDINIILEGEGFQVHSRRNKFEMANNVNKPSSGSVKQITTGIDVVGTFSCILDVGNIDFLLSMLDRAADIVAELILHPE